MRNPKPSNSKLTSQDKKKQPRFSNKQSPSTLPSHPYNSSDSVALDSLREDDLIAIDAFCKDFEFNDMTLSDWEQGFDALDVSIPIWISSKDARDGCERLIEFSRSVRTEWDGPSVREKMQITLHVPSGSVHQARLSISGKGDRRGGQQGDLIVIIHVKDS